VILGALMIPIHMVLMPLFVLSRQMGVLSSPWAVIGPYVAFGIPFSVFIFRGFFINIPGTLVEAAKIDGATETGVFFKVMLPNAKPAMATVLIFQFLAAWNEFLFALVLLQDQKSYTLPLGLANFQGQYTANYPVLAAGLFMACLPGLLLYGFFNKVVIRGMAEGAIKG
jgi:raffinose/stachyose/melibiose transport system permease protein